MCSYVFPLHVSRDFDYLVNNYITSTLHNAWYRCSLSYLMIEWINTFIYLLYSSSWSFKMMHFWLSLASLTLAKKYFLFFFYTHLFQVPAGMEDFNNTCLCLYYVTLQPSFTSSPQYKGMKKIALNILTNQYDPRAQLIYKWLYKYGETVFPYKCASILTEETGSTARGDFQDTCPSYQKHSWNKLMWWYNLANSSRKIRPELPLKALEAL